MQQLLLSFSLLVVTLNLGCGARVGNLSGEVLLDNTPLPAGRVSVLCEVDDKPVHFSIIREGRYRFEEIPVGPAIITVETFPPSIPGPAPPSAAAPLNELPVDGMEEIEKVELLGAYIPIPARFRDPEKSGLKVTITGGEQTYDLHLQKGEEATP